MLIKHITIVNRVAKYSSRDGDIICNNDGYKVSFSFDSEWDKYPKKYARFIWNGMYKDVPFTGTECPIPKIQGAVELRVGVCTGDPENITDGDFWTTVSASIPCQKSVLCQTNQAQPDRVQQMRDITIEASERAVASATSAEADAKKAKEHADAAARSHANVNGIIQDAIQTATNAAVSKSTTEAKAAAESAAAIKANLETTIGAAVAQATATAGAHASKAKEHADAAAKSAEEARNIVISQGAPPPVVQTTGTSTTDVMSQKVTSASFANAVKSTAQGEVVRVSDASPVVHPMKVKAHCLAGVNPTGVTVKAGGKNLIPFPYPLLSGTTTKSGVTATVQADGGICFNGTSTEITWWNLAYDTLDNKPIRYFRDPWSPDAYSKRFTANSSAGNEYGTSPVWAVSAGDGIVFIELVAGAYKNLVVYPQIELGQESTEYEKGAPVQTGHPNANGEVELASAGSELTVWAIEAGVTVEVEYNVDLEKRLNELSEPDDDNTESIVQTTGNSEEAVMSQKASSASFANAVKSTARGEVVSVSDVSPTTHPVKAKVTCPNGINPSTVTIRAGGKNLIPFPYPLLSGTTTKSGVTATVQEDGGVCFNGTSTEITWWNLARDTLDNKPIWAYRDPFSPDFCSKRFTANSSAGNEYGVQRVWSVSAGDGTVFIELSAGTYQNLVVYPQIEAGEKSTEYEKGAAPQTATPNANGEIELVSVGNNLTVWSIEAGVTVEAEYNVDLESRMGDIEGLEKASVASFANAVKSTAQGNVVSVADVSPVAHPVKAKVTCPDGVNPTGVTVKAGGKNLIPFPYPLLSGTTIKSGLTATVQEDGGICFNGTSTEITWWNLARDTLDNKPIWSYRDPFSPDACSKRFTSNSSAGNEYGAPRTWAVAAGDGRILIELSAGTYENLIVYPQIEAGENSTEYEKGAVLQSGNPNANGEVEFVSVGSVLTVWAIEEDVTVEAEYNVDLETITHKHSKSDYPYADFLLPVVYFEGSTKGMSKDNKVTLAYRYDDRAGTCTLKWQGSSSIAYPKKNYTVVFDNAFEAREGWGEEKKYCLKADWIDASHLHNVTTAKLWGDIVRTRKTSDLVTRLSALPNCGAIDGFPCFVVINGEWQGIYNFNIPKEGWMFGMDDDNAKHAILCAENSCDATRFLADGVLNDSFALEYNAETFAEADIQASLNRLINACIDSDGTDIDTTIAQYLDIDSAIDYMILTAAIRAIDILEKNYLLVTFDGTKWFFSAYDLDCVYGLHWNGSELYNAGYLEDGMASMSFEFIASRHRLFRLLYDNKRADIIKRYKELRKTVLSPSWLSYKFYNYGRDIPRTAFDAELTLWGKIPSNNGNDAHYVATWYAERVKWVDEEIAEMENSL